MTNIVLKPLTGIEELLFEFDFSHFLKYVMSISSDEWDHWKYRNLHDMPLEAATHRFTRAIRIQWIPLDVEFFDKSKIEYFEPHYSNTLKLLGNLLDYLEFFYDGEIYKIIIAKMLPNSTIKNHIDSGFSLTIPHRIHIPLLTNDNVFFGCGPTVMNMKYGKIYEINNNMEHFVYNDSPHERIHLIIDVIEKSHGKEKQN